MVRGASCENTARPVSLVLAYAREADNNKMAKIAHKINMCVKYISPDVLGGQRLSLLES